MLTTSGSLGRNDRLKAVRPPNAIAGAKPRSCAALIIISSKDNRGAHGEENPKSLSSSPRSAELWDLAQEISRLGAIKPSDSDEEKVQY